MTQPERHLDWLSCVVNRSNLESRELVAKVLSQNSIRQSPSIGKPRRLIIKRIQFSGMKTGNFTDSFNFDFKNLESGLWGLISDRNLKGKTSVLEIIRWLLRGKSSSKLQDGVKSWITEANLEFLIDTTNYKVHLLQQCEEVTGNLSENSDQPGFYEISHFASEDEFEACMSDFMMRQFSLDVASAWRKSDDQNEIGKPVFHDWSAISGILFVGSDYKAIFGDLVSDGLNNRLMNMYLGLPWIPTLDALKTAQKKLQDQKRILCNQSKFDQNQQQEQRNRIERELNIHRTSLEKIPSDANVREALSKVHESHRLEMQNMRVLDNELYSVRQEHDELNRLLLQEQKDFKNFCEAKAASVVFRRLEPTCCPHCQVSISEDRRLREIAEHSCSICGEVITDSEDTDDLEKELKTGLDELLKSVEEIRKLVLLKEKEVAKCQSQISNYRIECTRLEYQLDNFKKRHELEKKIAGLEFLLKEHQEIQTPEENDDNLDIELKIIKAAIAETDERVKTHQTVLLEEVSQKIKEYATRFGMISITSATLTSNPHLRLNKDGGETTYSNCTDGEKLRLKIAAIIALISIAESKGIGRHPGLILIDSPKSEEMVENDVDQLIGGLSELTKELPHLQIILAATSSESVLRHLDEEHRKYAEGNSFLW